MPNRELEGLYAEMHLHPVLQVEESHKEGREIYKDEVYVTIQIKGQKNQIRDRKMRESDKDDFPTAWKRWSEKEHALKTGTPVNALPGVGPSMVIELKALGIHTVEDMATLSDAGCTNMRGGYMFRERAKAYMAASSIKPEPTIVEHSEEQPVDIDEMRATPGVVQRTDPPRRGRPPKNRAVI